MLSFLVNFIEQWLGSLPKVMFSFLGVLVCVVVVSALWDRRMRSFSAALAILAGLAMTFNAPLLRIFTSLTPEQRIGFFGVAGGIGVIAMTVMALKKSVLQGRYAIFWFGCGVGLIVVFLHPAVQLSLKTIAQNSALMVIGGVAGLLFFLFAFHVSIAITRLEQRYQRLRKTLSPVGTNGRQTSGDEGDADDVLLNLSLRSLFAGFSGESVRRRIRGASVGVPLIMIIATLAVIITGLAAPQAMIGDEVTHYYMLVKQGQDISKPNFFADIPMADGGIETRRYPHSFGWHYLGALVYRASQGSFSAVQLYQAVFFFQLLLVAYLLARSRGGVESRSALVYVLALASLPVCLIFSVAFYQDVPMSAQALTAFYFLEKRRWFVASLFLSLALWMKVTAVLFFPAFFILLALWQIRGASWFRGGITCIVALLIVLSATWMLGRAINVYGHTSFYPQEKMQIMLSIAKNRFSGIFLGTEEETMQEVAAQVRAAQQHPGNTPQETAPVIIANHPGDLRIKQNYLVYGGVLLWGVFFAGALSYVPPFRKKISRQMQSSGMWLLGVGGSYLIMTAYMIRSAPDARFFLPALPFLLLPIIERIVHFPRPKILITIIATLAFLQGGYVLKEAYSLRFVPDGMQEGIEYLAKNPPSPERIFMYPEGNYRFFPYSHEWYLGYRLREFWRADNDRRIQLLQQFGIGAIVIKKRLISPVDEDITNLGVYPVYFVEDIERDDRFVKVFENADLLIYRTPEP